MKILFSPSEAKIDLATYDKIDQNSFLFKDLYKKRVYVLEKYQQFIKNATDNELKKLFGVKDIDLFKSLDIFQNKTLKSIQRYSGVAFEYLNYKTLDSESKEFLHNNLIIFSNLFGPILAKDHIPYYKLKQGERLGEFKIEDFYKQNFSNALDEYLKDELILDLRASFYEKFYIPNKKYITMKFLKNGKSISHFAKAYRGKVVRILALNRPKNEDELYNIEFENLKIVEIIEKSLKKEFIFEIV